MIEQRRLRAVYILVVYIEIYTTVTSYRLVKPCQFLESKACLWKSQVLYVVIIINHLFFLELIRLLLLYKLLDVTTWKTRNGYQDKTLMCVLNMETQSSQQKPAQVYSTNSPVYQSK